MRQTLQDTDVELAAGAILSLSNVRDLIVTCDAGELWITLDGDRRDIILSRGGSLAVARNVRIVINALRSSRIRLRGRTRRGTWI